jgi:hypothetical protein
VFTPGDHFRLIGLEITRPVDGKWHNALVNPQYSDNILDRCWIHGDAVDETSHLVEIAPTADRIAVIDSYLSDAHCTAVTGACVEAQDITVTGGGQAIKVFDDFLEASTQSILLGGGAASTVASDVEIRLNHFFKPLLWNRLDASFFGTTFIVKNNLELKEGQRIFVEGNILENTWGGFSADAQEPGRGQGDQPLPDLPALRRHAALQLRAARSHGREHRRWRKRQPRLARRFI